MLSIQDIANYTGLPKATIYNWQNKSIIPKEVESVHQVVKPIIAYLKQKKEKGEERKAKTDTFEELELETKKAYLGKLLEEERRLRIDNDLKEGLLLEAAQVEAVWEPIIIAINKKLNSLPNNLAHRLVAIDNPNLIQEILNQAINDILEDMGGEDFAERAIDREESTEAVETEAEVDSFGDR